MTENGTTGRFLLPKDVDGTKVKLLVCDGDQQWRSVSFHQSGSYLVFDLTEGDCRIALVQTVSYDLLWIAVGVGGAVVVLAAALILRKKFSKKKTVA